MPRAAAARATATSPSGCTACTPVGDSQQAGDIPGPSPWSRHLRVAGSPATCGQSWSSNAAPSSRKPRAPPPPTSAPYTEPGSRRLARRCATATVSNHLSAIASGYLFYRLALQRPFDGGARRARHEDLHVHGGGQLSVQTLPQPGGARPPGARPRPRPTRTTSRSSPARLSGGIRAISHPHSRHHPLPKWQTAPACTTKPSALWPESSSGRLRRCV